VVPYGGVLAVCRVVLIVAPVGAAVCLVGLLVALAMKRGRPTVASAPARAAPSLLRVRTDRGARTRREAFAAAPAPSALADPSALYLSDAGVPVTAVVTRALVAPAGPAAAPAAAAATAAQEAAVGSGTGGHGARSRSRSRRESRRHKTRPEGKRARRSEKKSHVATGLTPE
jgi:hypothetical protein